MILKSLLRRKTRTLLTMAGVAIGVAAIVAQGALATAIVLGAVGGIYPAWLASRMRPV